MSGSGRHSKRRGGIYDGSRGVKQTQVRKKGGIMALLVAKLAGVPVPVGGRLIRSKSVTKQFRRARRQNA